MAFVSRAQLVITVLGCTVGAVAVARHEQRSYALEHARAAHNSARAPERAMRADQARRGPLDVNLAPAIELETLPGVGPRLAARIVAHRLEHGPFRSAQELDAVPGVGAKLLAKLLPHVRVPETRSKELEQPRQAELGLRRE